MSSQTNNSNSLLSPSQSNAVIKCQQCKCNRENFALQSTTLNVTSLFKKNKVSFSIGLLSLFHPVRRCSKPPNPLRKASGGKNLLLWFGLETSVCTEARTCTTRTAVHCSAHWFWWCFKVLAGTDSAGRALWARGTLYAFPAPLSDGDSSHPRPLPFSFLGLWNWTNLTLLCYLLWVQNSSQTLCQFFFYFFLTKLV